MRAAARSLALLALAAAACGETARDDPANNAAVADVEALPPDESVATTSEELANGVDEPSANELANVE